MRCDECRFWSFVDESIGECRRHAPLHLLAELERRENGTPKEAAVWPHTDNSEWCGEFQDKSMSASASPVAALPVESLNLSVRARRAMAGARITKIGHLLTMSNEHLQLVGCGITSREEISNKLARLGLQLRAQ